ncbi:MAG TPA: TonB-dependent receptor [Chryseosolibacter sp.]|nr:TonB-dependent receptor [Chryseosolibacter sp.]
MQFILTLICVIGCTTVHAQSQIAGDIVDKKGAPVPLANVLIADTYDGATADANGHFEFTTAETGQHRLVITMIGFRTHEQLVVLDGARQSFKVILEELVNELQAVTISAGSFMASDESRRTVFRAVDIATTAGATADIAGALNTLPGTQKVGETGRLFVRGGDGDEAKTFIDGMVVMEPYGASGPNTPSRGRFLPFMFKGTSFSTGGYSAEYGQALSSALALESKDEAEIGRTDIGILSVGADVTHTYVWSGGSAAGKIQYTDIRPYYGLVNQEIDWKTPPSSIEGTTAFRQKIGNGGILKVFGNINRSTFALYNHDIDNYDKRQLYDLTNRYHYWNTAYRNTLNDSWTLRGGISYTNLSNEIVLDNHDRIEQNEEGFHAKGVAEGSLSDNVELKTGVEVIARDLAQRSVVASNVKEVIAAGFSETDVYASNNFVTRAGARLEYNSLQKKASADPRVSLAYKVGTDGQVSLAYGIFRQSVKKEFLLLNPGLSSEKAAHYMVNYQRINNRKTFRIEAYYKRYCDLVRYELGNKSDLDNSGEGYARGFELFWRDGESVKKLDYWLSYSFLDTEREYLNFPVAAVPTFASRHNFSAVAKYFVTDLRSQLGATYSFASARPYHDPNTSSFNASRTPAYHDLSFNWSYLPKPYAIVYFSCTNLLGRDNIFGYEFSDKLNEGGIFNGRPVRQPAPRFIFLGIFITLSQDKTVNQLPSL